MAQRHSTDPIEKILTEARFQFALKYLHTIIRQNENKNVVFSPYNMYEGLLMIYLASSGDTELYLKYKLGLPESIFQEDITNWILRSKMDKKEEDEKLPDYNTENRCWITNNAYANDTAQRLFKKKLEIVGFHKDCATLKNWINELLRKKTQGYIRQPMELNDVYKKMEMILLAILCFKDDIVKENISTDEMHSLKEPRTVVSPKLEMIVTELPFVNKNVSFFILFPAVRNKSNEWLEKGKILELIKKLTTREGINELRKVLDDQEAITEKLKGERMIYPNSFELQNEFEINNLGNLNNLPKFADQNLQLGGSKHCAYIKVKSNYITASAVTMFFTERQGRFNPTKNFNHSKCTKKFIWMLYCRESHTILLAGINNEYKLPLPTTEFSDKCSVD